MSWFYIALIGPVLYAISNHLDNFILKKYCGNIKAGALVLFSAFFSVVVLPVIYFIEPSVFSLGFKTSAILLINGTFNIICLTLYFEALKKEESSVVVPYYQTIPVITFILGYFILGEVLNLDQIIGGGMVLLGTLIISLSFADNKIRIRKRVMFLMLTASLLYSVNGIIFKYIALDQGFWNSVFWEFAGNVFIGILIFLFISSYRKQFLQVFGSNKKRLISLNSLNEAFTLVAEGVFAYAVLLAPISLVNAVNGLQPFFVFVFGIILTHLFPHIAKESMEKTHLAQKILAIGIIISGIYLLGSKGLL